MLPYCPISSTVSHTFTTPTHLTLPPHTSTPPTTTAGQLSGSFGPTFATIAAHTFLSRMHFLCLKALAPSMNNTPATNTRANRSLSHEPKTHSPPPSLPAQQVAQAIQSSPPVLSPSPPPPTAPPRRRTPAANRTWSRSRYTVTGAPLLLMPSLARKRYKYNGLSLTCTPGCLWECFHTSHLEI